jgi:hypothetical protein
VEKTIKISLVTKSEQGSGCSRDKSPHHSLTPLAGWPIF